MTADDVRALRERLGLTQEEFAAELGVTGRTVSRWESGEGEPSRLAGRAFEQLAKRRKK